MFIVNASFTSANFPDKSKLARITLSLRNSNRFCLALERNLQPYTLLSQSMNLLASYLVVVYLLISEKILIQLIMQFY